MGKWFVYSLLLLAMTGCSAPKNAAEGRWVVDDFSRKLYKEQQFSLVSQKGPRYNEDRLLALTLHYKGFHTVDRREARRMVVQELEKLLHAFNTNPAAHPFGERHPLSSKEISLTLEFDSFYGDFVNPNAIRFVTANEGYITFYSHDCESLATGCTKWKEPYDEAFRRVQRLVEIEARTAQTEAQEDETLRKNNARHPEWGIPLGEFMVPEEERTPRF